MLLNLSDVNYYWTMLNFVSFNFVYYFIFVGSKHADGILLIGGSLEKGTSGAFTMLILSIFGDYGVETIIGFWKVKS